MDTNIGYELDASSGSSMETPTRHSVGLPTKYSKGTINRCDLDAPAGSSMYTPAKHLGGLPKKYSKGTINRRDLDAPTGSSMDTPARYSGGLPKKYSKGTINRCDLDAPAGSSMDNPAKYSGGILKKYSMSNINSLAGSTMDTTARHSVGLPTIYSKGTINRRDWDVPARHPVGLPTRYSKGAINRCDLDAASGSSMDTPARYLVGLPTRYSKSTFNRCELDAPSGSSMDSPARHSVDPSTKYSLGAINRCEFDAPAGSYKFNSGKYAMTYGTKNSGATPSNDAMITSRSNDLEDSAGSSTENTANCSMNIPSYNTMFTVNDALNASTDMFKKALFSYNLRSLFDDPKWAITSNYYTKLYTNMMLQNLAIAIIKYCETDPGTSESLLMQYSPMDLSMNTTEGVEPCVATTSVTDDRRVATASGNYQHPSLSCTPGTSVETVPRSIVGHSMEIDEISVNPNVEISTEAYKDSSISNTAGNNIKTDAGNSMEFVDDINMVADRISAAFDECGDPCSTQLTQTNSGTGFYTESELDAMFQSWMHPPANVNNTLSQPKFNVSKDDTSKDVINIDDFAKNLQGTDEEKLRQLYQMLVKENTITVSSQVAQEPQHVKSQWLIVEGKPVVVKYLDTPAGQSKK